MSIKYLFLIILLSINAYSSVQYASYKISYGIFGQVGTAQARLEKNQDNYTIEVKAKAEGSAALISRNREETHKSHGKIIQGIYIPSEYEIIKKWGNKKIHQFFTFNHITRQIKEIKESYSNDTLTRTIETTRYASNDILSLYFNTLDKLPTFSAGSRNIFSVVGADNEGGRILISVPEESELPSFKKHLGESGYYLSVQLNQKIFASDKGGLKLLISPQKICQTAILEDVLFFGDIKATLIESKYIP